MTTPRILVVEDDLALRRALVTSLRARDHDVIDVGRGEDALVVAADGGVDVIVLDVMLPGIDGLEVLRRLRAFSDVPVLMLTARDRQVDKVQALDLGADDYVTKPFDTEELLARLRALLRRRPSAAERKARYEYEGLVVDLASQRVERDGELVHLTKTEFALLEQLITNPGRLLTRDQLLHRVWGPGYGEEHNYLRVYIRQLRQKLGDDAAEPRLILTETGVGYRWIAESSGP